MINPPTTLTLIRIAAMNDCGPLLVAVFYLPAACSAGETLHAGGAR